MADGDVKTQESSGENIQPPWQPTVLGSGHECGMHIGDGKGGTGGMKEKSLQRWDLRGECFYPDITVSKTLSSSTLT